jgi:hypothetical protein
MKRLPITVVAAGLACGAAALMATAAVAVTVYLPPTHSSRGALRLCPSLVGLEGFSKSAVITARADVMRYGRVSRADDLAASDLAWQPEVRSNWNRPHHKPGHGPQFVLGPVRATPVAKQSYGIIVRYSCGSKILSHTLEFTVVPGHRSHPPSCDACRTTFFVIDRYGHPLIYFIY